MLTTQDEPHFEQLLDHLHAPFHRGHCPEATHAAVCINVKCGDGVRVELRVTTEGIIADAWFDGTGCCISQASASLFTEWSVGRTADMVDRLSDEQALALLKAPLMLQRQQCALLAPQALRKALHTPLAAK